MIRHVSMLTFVDGGGVDVEAIARALSQLPSRIPALRSYSFGRYLHLAPDNAHFVVIADFDDVAGYESYRDDPEHRRILAELIRPVLAHRAVVQYEC